MVWKCCVWKCSSSLSSRDQKLNFYRFPTPSNNRLPLIKRRFEAWKKVLGFGDKFVPTNKRICNLHFVSGKPARLNDENHEDWVPTLNLSRQNTNKSSHRQSVEESSVSSSSEDSSGSQCSSSFSSISPSHRNRQDTTVAGTRRSRSGSHRSSLYSSSARSSSNFSQSSECSRRFRKTGSRVSSSSSSTSQIEEKVVATRRSPRGSSTSSSSQSSKNRHHRNDSRSRSTSSVSSSSACSNSSIGSRSTVSRRSHKTGRKQLRSSSSSISLNRSPSYSQQMNEARCHDASDSRRNSSFSSLSTVRNSRKRSRHHHKRTHRRSSCSSSTSSPDVSRSWKESPSSPILQRNNSSIQSSSCSKDARKRRHSSVSSTRSSKSDEPDHSSIQSSSCSKDARKRRHSSVSSTRICKSDEPLELTQSLDQPRNASTQISESIHDSTLNSSSGTSTLDSNGENHTQIPTCCCLNENCEFSKKNHSLTESLNRKIARLTDEANMNARDFKFISVSDEKCLYYTGISTFTAVQHLFNYLKDNITQPHCNFSKEQVFVMTLTKLRLNHQFQTLAYDYKVCPNTISKYFHRTLEIMDRCLGYALEAPTRNVLSNHTPKKFKDQFGDARIFIIDCFEVHSETPENLKAAVSHYSNYKKSETTKFLIAICPDGNISFISPGYGGRCSDKKIFQDSGIMDCLQPGDIVIADKGFDIADLVHSRGAYLNIPTFLKNKKQFKPTEIEMNRQVTKFRIHVERCIAGLKNKFMIISQTIPVDLLARVENGKSIVDLVARVCCILYNFNPSIIPK